MGQSPADNPYGVKFSQPHALALVDMDGDGFKDIVTGKRFLGARTRRGRRTRRARGHLLVPAPAVGGPAGGVRAAPG
jgi:hypothetical protein